MTILHKAGSCSLGKFLVSTVAGFLLNSSIRIFNPYSSAVEDSWKNIKTSKQASINKRPITVQQQIVVLDLP